MMARPFKIRRFGHFGFNLERLDEAIEFYTEILGFRITDEASLFSQLKGRGSDKARQVVSDPRMIFTSNTSDHHALLLTHRSFGEFMSQGQNPADSTLSQITWQVGTLEEVLNAESFLRDQGVRIGRVGRDMPGGNWHVYFLDPDGNTVELYYGIEQIGWSRASRPFGMHYRGFDSRPPLPQMSEAAELRDAQDRGIDLDSGWHPDESGLKETYDVGGVLLPRPFKVTRIGPMSLFTEQLDELTEFYTQLLGFEVTEETNHLGHRAVFLRAGSEHHSLVLVDKALRSILGLSEHSSCMSVGMEVGTYSQLRAAVEYLSKSGYTQEEAVPPRLYPGIDYAAHFRDPDGHLVQLYYYMEQVGWDGSPRPPRLRRPVMSPWPETVDTLSDTYVDQTYLGPLG